MKIYDSENRLLKRPKTFEELLENDPFGLLSNVGEKRLSMSDSDKINVFIMEAAEFVKEHKRFLNFRIDKMEGIQPTAKSCSTRHGNPFRNTIQRNCQRRVPLSFAGNSEGLSRQDVRER